MRPPPLVFWHKYQIETGWDFGYVELSTDGGQSWPYRLATVTGISPWKREQIDLTPFAGQINVKIRFRLVTDKDVNNYDGWTIDDVSIGEPPHAVAELSITNPQISSLTLAWTQNLDGILPPTRSTVPPHPVSARRAPSWRPSPTRRRRPTRIQA
jgi:hypothetical protein